MPQKSGVQTTGSQNNMFRNTLVSLSSPWRTDRKAHSGSDFWAVGGGARELAVLKGAHRSPRSLYIFYIYIYIYTYIHIHIHTEREFLPPSFTLHYQGLIEKKWAHLNTCAGGLRIRLCSESVGSDLWEN